MNMILSRGLTRAAILCCASATALSAAHAQQAPAADAGSEEIVVTGIRASIANAIAEKKSSDLIVESISATDIGKLPDTSIAESIARLPGLTTQRLDGRAQVISIRGLAPDFSTTLLNGREQVTTGDNRGVEFDQYPSEIMSQVNVYKTPSANLIGAGLSGTVDLRTIRPLTFGKRALALNARGEWLSLGKLNAGSKDFGYRFSGSYVDQFADDTVGIALAVSHMMSPSQFTRFEAWGYPTTGSGDAIIGGVKPHVVSSELTRTAVMATVEWKPSDAVSSAIDVFYTKFKDNQIKRGIEFPLYWSGAQLQPGYTAEDGFVTAGQFNDVKGVIRNDANRRDADLVSIGWNVSAGNDVLHATFDANYSMVKRTDLIIETYSGTGRAGVGATDNMGFTMTDRGIMFNSKLNYADSATIGVTSPQGWGSDIVPGGQDGYYNDRHIKDEILALRFGAERDLGGGFRSLELGFNYSGRVKTLTPDEYFLSAAASANGTKTVPIPSEYLLSPTALDFIGVSGMVSYDPLALLDSGFFNTTRNPNADVTTKAWRVQEDVFTGYLQLNIDATLGSSTLTGNVGVQLVNTSQRSSGTASSGTGSGVISVPISESVNYTQALPTLNLVLRGENDLVARLGIARQMARPPMDNMRAAINFSYNSSLAGSPDINHSPWSGSGGNPKLRPWLADAVDFSLEKYFGREAYVSAALFYKNLKSYIYEQSVLFDFTGFPVSGGPEPVLRQGFVNIWSNGKGGHIQGFELAGSLPFSTFTPALEGLGVQGSYSYTDSNIQPDPNSPSTPLPGLSKHVWNATAYFEKSGIQLRGSVRHRSSFLAEISAFGGGRERRMAQGETVVDAQIGYEFQRGSALEGLSILLQGYNLTNEPFVTYVNGDERQVRDYQEYGRRFLVGVNYRF